MARRRLPDAPAPARVSVNLPASLWQQVIFLAWSRGPQVSAAAIVREALTEYVARRVGPQTGTRAPAS